MRGRAERRAGFDVGIEGVAGPVRTYDRLSIRERLGDGCLDARFGVR